MALRKLLQITGKFNNSALVYTFCLTKLATHQCCLRRSFGQPAAQTHPHLIKQGEVTPGITQEEYKQRRTALFINAVETFKKTRSVKGHILLFPSASKSYMTYDIPYPFRQNSEFLYLCGFQEPDSVLVLHSVNEGYTSILFVPKRDPDTELWDGPRSGDAGAIQLTGVSDAHNIDELENYLYSYCKQNSDYMVWYDVDKKVHRKFHDNFFDNFIQESGKRAVENPTPFLHKQRLIKSEAEIELMQRSCEIASEAIVDVMKFSYPGVNESHLYAKMDFECRVRNAEILAYPPVVAGGNRANTIHYINNNQLVHGGEMVLMDAGCEFHGYTSDLTRTWPVSGKFTPAQRAVYLAVLQIQDKCIAMCTSDYSLTDIYREMLKLIKEQLIQLGIIEPVKEDTIMRASQFCPHHVGHYLGMDVHDTPTISKHVKLAPGMIITIEPGIYLPKDRDDIPEEYRGMGIRIEDNILVTNSKPVILSSTCPKHPDDIERILSER